MAWMLKRSPATVRSATLVDPVCSDLVRVRIRVRVRGRVRVRVRVKVRVRVRVRVRARDGSWAPTPSCSIR